MKQYGFRPKRGTKSLLSEFVDELNPHLNAKRHIVLVFIDCSKAFNTLRHFTMYKKIKHAGIRGALLQWTKNYLENRNYIENGKYIYIYDQY